MSGAFLARSIILGVGIGGITVAGTIYGAQMKGDKEVAQKQEETRQASSEEIIESLESRIAGLKKTRSGYMTKISALDQKIQQQENEKSGSP